MSIFLLILSMPCDSFFLNFFLNLILMCFNCIVLYFSLVYVGLVKATISALLSLVVLPTVCSVIVLHMWLMANKWWWWWWFIYRFYFTIQCVFLHCTLWYCLRFLCLQKFR